MVREAARYDFPEFATSGRRMSGTIARDMGRSAASTYRFERDGGPPADPARRRLWLILQLNGGEPISASSVRDALAGVNRNRPGLLFAQTANQAIDVQNRPRTGDAHGGEEGAEKRRR
jgi:hypothetical protein